MVARKQPRTRALVRRRRLPIPLLLPLSVYGAVALILLPLAIIPKHIDVALEVAASELRFDPAGSAPLLTNLPIRSFVVQPGHQVTLGDGCLRIGGPAAPCAPLHMLPVAPGTQMTVAAVEGTMTVSRVPVPAGVHFALRALDGKPPLLQLRVDGAQADIPFAPGRLLRLACAGCWRDAAGQPTSEALFRSDGPELGHVKADGVLSLTLEPSETDLIGRRDGTKLLVDQVAFIRSMDGRPIPAIDTAEVTPLTQSGPGETWKSKSLHLAPGDRFTLISLALSPGKLTVSLEGRAVSSLSTDEGDRLPSLLEAMMGNRAWALYFNAIAAIGSVVLSVITLLYKARPGEGTKPDAP